MTIQIIGAGFGRTGTASLKLALEKIGFGPCYHMSEVLQNPSRHIDLWLRAADRDPDWGALLGAYGACVDFPVCSFYGELAEAYPDAKVVLTHRDPGRWFDSIHATIMSPEFTRYIDSTPFGVLNKRTVWDRFDGRIHDRAHMIDCFERHVAQVKATIPAHRLLVYEVKQGWAPLCGFLGVGVPDEPFPHVNTTEETSRLLAELVASDDHTTIDDQLDAAGKGLYKEKGGS